MRSTLFFLLLALTACEKGPKIQSHQFVLDCKFPDLHTGVGSARVVISDARGVILASVTLAQGQTSLTQSLTFDTENPTDRYDVHLSYYLPGNHVRTFTHLKVQSGALVAFEPALIAPPPLLSSQKFVVVREVLSLEAYEFLGWNTIETPLHIAQDSTAVAASRFDLRQNLILRVRANAEPAPRYFFLPPDSLQNQGLYLNWSDAKPATELVALPAYPDGISTELTSVSADFQEVTPLGTVQHQSNPNPTFFRPTEAEGNLRVKSTGFFYEFEKIFAPGEPLEMPPTDMKITRIERPFLGRLEIEAEGDIDILQVDDFSLFGFWWRIEGRPSDFLNVNLPVSESTPTSLFTRFNVTARQYADHDYEQVREGFPLRSTEPFAVARSGYRAVVKKY
jgi:hypothetical protein